MRSILRALAAIVISLVLTEPAASSDRNSTSEPIAVTAEPIVLAPFDRSRTDFGELTWIGGMTLSSADPRFGGFSGLAVSAEGSRLVAVSDEGWWLAGEIERRDGRPSGLLNARMAPLLAADGSRSRSKSRRDAEALAPWDGTGIDGSLIVGFEQRERLEIFDVGRFGFAARPRPLAFPGTAASGPVNGEIEAVGRFFEGPRKGWLLALSEDQFDGQGNIVGWLWNGRETATLRLSRHGDYKITDLAILQGGKSFVTLERSYSPPIPPGMAIRRFSVAGLKSGGAVAGELLFEGRRPFYAIDNMEAISARRATDGLTILAVLSDDNYNRALQSTLLIEFALEGE